MKSIAALLCSCTLLCGPPGPTSTLAADAAPTSQPVPIKPREFTVPDGVKVLRDVEYARVGAISLKLDIYLPLDAGKPLPLIVWIHGGGWSAGDKNEKGGCWFFPMLRRGYVIASINYRLTGQASFPAQIDDCKAALRFLRAHAKEYSIDPHCIGVAGASAGGHLAALLGVTGDSKDLEGTVGDCLTESTRVQAVIDFAGPADFPLFLRSIHSDPLTARNAGPAVKGLLGGLNEKVADVALKASPVTYASSKTPPFLIIHGGQDKVVPPTQAKALFDALKTRGADASLLIVPNSGHVFGLTGEETLARAYDFFERRLRNTPATHPAARSAS